MTARSAQRPPKPKPPVNRARMFDLDLLEREGDTPPPFGFRVGGDEFIVGDIDDLDWKTVLTLRRDDMILFFQSALGDDYGKFAKHNIPLWKVNELAKRLDEHFGWSAKAGEEGEDDASSTS